MRSTGVIVLSVFAAVWAFLGLHTSGQVLWVQVVPFALSLALTLAVLIIDRHAARPTPEDRKRIGRTVMIWSFIEGLAIFAGINVLANIGHNEWTLALIAVIVGLHFFPLAVGLRVPLYWLTGLGLIGVAAAGVVLVPSGTVQSAAIGVGCASVLYLTAVIAIAFAPKPKMVAA